MLKIKIYIVQSEHGGIPDEPMVTLYEKSAEMAYLGWWNNELQPDKPIKTLDELQPFIEDYSGDNFCRRWEKDLTITILPSEY